MSELAWDVEFEDPVRRQRLRFANDGDVLLADVVTAPGGDVPAHRHPHQEERFQVLAGEAWFRVGRQRQRARSGDRIVVPAGVVHAFRNDTDANVRLRIEVEPALRLREFLTSAAELARAGAYTQRGIPTRPRAILDLAELMVRHADVTVMAFPPRIVQRLTLPPLAALAAKRAKR